MKKSLFVIAAAALMGSASALAADMPKAYTKAPAYKAAPGYNWTGWYGGVNVGLGVSQMNGAFNETPGAGFDRGNIGLTGGVQIGYNWQLAPQWVIGLEGDIGYLGIDRSFSEFAPVADAFGMKTDWYGTLRGRFGYTNGPSLFYATGGAAFVNVRNNFDFLAAPLTFASKSETATGWTAGGGIETMLGGNWSAKAEYLYIDAAVRTSSIPLMRPPTSPTVFTFTDMA